MNWSNLLRFRKQVEEMAREEVTLAEWERSREEAKRDCLQDELQMVARELEKNMQSGVGKVFAEQRFQWLDEIGTALESLSHRLQHLENKTRELREKLKKAHHARRVVEIVIAKKEAAIMQKVAKQEQAAMEEAAAYQYITTQSGESWNISH